MAKKDKLNKKNKQTNKNLSFGNLIDRVTPNSVEFKSDRIILGDTEQKIYTVYDYPPEVNLEWLSDLTRYQNCFVTYQVSEANKNELIESIDRTISMEKVRQLESNSQIDIDESEDIIDRSRMLAKKIRSDEGKAVNLTISLGVFGSNEDEVKKNFRKVSADLEGKDFSIRAMTQMQKEGFLQQLPICDNEYESLSGIDMPIDTWAAGLGIFTNQALDHTSGTYIGTDRSGEPAFWDIWNVSKDQQNSNMVITGTPGAGKSTTMKKMLLNQFGRGDNLIILDAEREYVGLGMQFGADIIEASGTETKATMGTEATVINPLQIRDFPESWDNFETQDALNNYLMNHSETDYQGPLSIHISFLKTWFPLYIPDLKMRHISILEKCLYETYKRKGINESNDPRFMSPEEFPIMSDLRNVIQDAIHTKQIGKENITDELLPIYKELDNYLYSCTEGADKYIFNGYTNIDMSNNAFTIFDVHKLLDSPENIKNAQFCNITTFCWMRMTKDRKEPCILVVDEAHLFISKRNNFVFEWLSTAARRFRKYYASLWLATQNISDFLSDSVSDFGQSLLNNPDLKFVMKQRSTDIEKLRNLFQLSKVEEDLILKSGRGEGLLFVGSSKHLFINVEVEPKMLKLISETGGGR